MNHERRFINRLAFGRSTDKLRSRDDHGTHRCYVAGCRCDPCTDAESAYSLERRRIRGERS